MTPTYKFDYADADELPLVFDSWSKSFKKSPWAGCIPNNLYPEVSRAGISEILDRGATVIVAYIDLPDGGRRVMGYSVSEPDKRILHWLFVKRDYRLPGWQVGTELLKYTMAQAERPHLDGWGPPSYTDKWTYTHRTPASAKFLSEQFEWDPVAARVRS